MDNCSSFVIGIIFQFQSNRFQYSFPNLDSNQHKWHLNAFIFFAHLRFRTLYLFSIWSHFTPLKRKLENTRAPFFWIMYNFKTSISFLEKKEKSFRIRFSIYFLYILKNMAWAWAGLQHRTIRNIKESFHHPPNYSLQCSQLNKV